MKVPKLFQRNLSLIKSKRKFVYFFLLFLIFVPCFVQAATYYVDATDGNDSWSGTTISASWKTISKANSATFSPGDQILFKRGETWREQLTVPSSGASGNPIVFGAYGSGEKPKILGSVAVIGTWDQDPISSTPLPSGCWKIAMASAPGKSNDGYGPIWFKNAGDGKWKWGWRQSALDQVNTEYEWYWHSAGYLVAYSLTNPETRYSAIENAKRANGVDAGWNHDYITIENLEIGFTARNGVHEGYSDSTNWVVQNYYVHHAGIFVGEAGYDGWSSCIYTEASYWTIRNGTFHDGGSHGVHMFAAGRDIHDFLVEGNTGSNCYHTIYDFKSSGGGTYLYNGVIRYNYGFTDSDWAKDGIYCHIFYCSGQSQAGHVYNLSFYYNIAFTPNNAGFSADAADNIRYYNNVVYGLNSENHTPYPHGWYLEAPNSNISFVNNIAMNTGDDCFWLDNTAMIGTFDYNGCYQSAGGSAVFATRNSPWSQWHYNDFAAYKSVTGFDTHGFWQDPKFVNPSSSDFHLQSTSPAVDTGASTGLTRDYGDNTVPRGSAPDIGAFEYVGTVTSPVDTTPPSAPTGVAVN